MNLIMATLPEICTSGYKHAPMYEFGKLYYKGRHNTQIICEECIAAWLVESTGIISSELSHYIDVFKAKNTQWPTLNGEYLRKGSILTAPVYMEYILASEFMLNVTLKSSEDDKLIGQAEITVCTPKANDSYKFLVILQEEELIEDIATRIRGYLKACIDMSFEIISADIVSIMMNNHMAPQYKSNCTCSTSSATSAGSGCSKCHCNVGDDYYIYLNTKYCLDCMYGIVVKLASQSGLTDSVGLSSTYIDQNSSEYMVRDTDEWKRSVIDKYILAMSSYGITVNIQHVIVSYL